MKKLMAVLFLGLLLGLSAIPTAAAEMQDERGSRWSDEIDRY